MKEREERTLLKGVLLERVKVLTTRPAVLFYQFVDFPQWLVDGTGGPFCGLGNCW